MISNIARHLGANRVGLAAQERQQQDVFRLEDCVAFQFGDPVAFLMLTRKEPVSRSLERRFKDFLRRLPSDAFREAKLPIRQAPGPRLLPCWRSFVAFLSSGARFPDNGFATQNQWRRGNHLERATSGAHPT